MYIYSNVVVILAILT